MTSSLYSIILPEEMLCSVDSTSAGHLAFFKESKLDVKTLMKRNTPKTTDSINIHQDNHFINNFLQFNINLKCD